MPMLRLILPGRGSFWKSSLRLRIGSPANGGTCSNMGSPLRVSGSERRLAVVAQRLRRVGGRIALDHAAVLADEELREVPLDGLGAEDARRFLAQPLPERVGVVAVDLDLRHHREGHAVVGFAEV